MVAAETRGQRIARRRERRGLTLERLAVLCRCSPRTIARIEADEHTSITSVLIEALHRHLSIPIRDLGAAARRGRGA